MTMKARICGAALVFGAVLAMAAAAHAQMLVTGITATNPDSADKVPGLDKVTGAAIPTWSSGLAQGVLTHGQSYDYCISIASGNVKGTASAAFRISRGATTIQAHQIIPATAYPVWPGGVWYYCSGFKVLPNSPGRASLTGTVAYYPTGVTKPTVSHLTVAVLLQ